MNDQNGKLIKALWATIMALLLVNGGLLAYLSTIEMDQNKKIDRLLAETGNYLSKRDFEQKIQSLSSELEELKRNQTLSNDEIAMLDDGIIQLRNYLISYNKEREAITEAITKDLMAQNLKVQEIINAMKNSNLRNEELQMKLNQITDIINEMKITLASANKDGLYDQTAFLVKNEEVERAKNSSLVLDFKGTTDIAGQGGLVISASWKGRGFIIEMSGTPYIATPAHVFHTQGKEKKSDTTVQWNGTKLEVIFEDLPRDLVLLKAPISLKGKGMPLGKSSELKEVNFVLIIGYPLGEGTFVRDGIISSSSSYASPTIRNYIKENFRGLLESDVMIVSYGGVYGDSGSMVLSSRDGKLEITGFHQGSLNMNGWVTFGWVLTVDAIKQTMKNHGIA